MVMLLGRYSYSSGINSEVGAARRLGGREGHAEVTGVACVRDMGRCQALMSVEAANGGSPDGGGRTHRMQRGARGARAAALLPRRPVLPPASPPRATDPSVVRAARQTPPPHAGTYYRT